MHPHVHQQTNGSSVKSLVAAQVVPETIEHPLTRLESDITAPA
ncbi:MAG TPA: hypothetical protein P5205_13340 [Candidatus Paceibacterota bacterium]|nr:hypothetical protein [Candidatus Paceibacterota bacterium]